MKQNMTVYQGACIKVLEVYKDWTICNAPGFRGVCVQNKYNGFVLCCMWSVKQAKYEIDKYIVEHKDYLKSKGYKYAV